MNYYVRVHMTDGTTFTRYQFATRLEAEADAKQLLSFPGVQSAKVYEG